VFIPEPILQTALQHLEAHAAHPDTPAIHDPIYRLSKDPNQEDMGALAAALVAHVGHPAVGKLRPLLEEYLDLPESDLVHVLSRHGGAPTGVDLIAEVDRRLGKASEARRILQTRVGALERELVETQRIANGVAALGAIALIFALIGWSIGLGVMEVSWIETPVPADKSGATSGTGVPAPGARAIR
jgi:hypothetical protein